MSTTTGIEWTDATWNPVTGCTPVSAGCANCYAVRQTFRLENMGAAKYAGLTVAQPNGRRQFSGIVRCHDDALDIPMLWRKPRRVFVNSMSDLFHDDVPSLFIWSVWDVMSRCPKHTFQLLTKRAERMCRMLRSAPAFLLSNVWLGVSVEDQPAADERIPFIRETPAAVRFLSVEPLLGPVQLDLTGIDWAIVGGESGFSARPCREEWVRSVIAQCAAAGVPCFVKQLGAQFRFAGEARSLKHFRGGDPGEWPEELRMRQFPEEATWRLL